MLVKLCVRCCYSFFFLCYLYCFSFSLFIEAQRTNTSKYCPTQEEAARGCVSVEGTTGESASPSLAKRLFNTYFFGNITFEYFLRKLGLRTTRLSISRDKQHIQHEEAARECAWARYPIICQLLG